MISTEKKKTSQVTSGTYDLIKGEFNPEEAMDVVGTLFTKKINFQKERSFSQLIRFGEEDPMTQKRIEELIGHREEAKNLIELAKATGKSLRVNSTVTIELI